MIDDTVFSTIERCGMLMPQDNVIVCVSGGADSMALLCFLHKNRARLALRSLCACHFNHGLRGAESDGEEAVVRRYCGALGIPLYCERAHMAQAERPQGLSVETWARELRYGWFSRLAAENDAKLATAHNQNDVAETLLFRLARGTGLRGAGGIPPVRGVFIRPFIDLPRDEIERYCAQNDIPYVTDSSNLSDDFARNKIRHAVLPALCGVNGEAVENIARFCAQAAELDAYMCARAQALLRRAETPDGWSAAVLLEEGETAARYALAALLRGVRAPDGRLVSLALQVARGELREVQLAENIYLRGDAGVLSLSRRGPANGEKTDGGAVALPADTRVLWRNKRVVARKSALIREQSGNFPKTLLNNALDCGTIIGNIILRGRREGDRFASARRGNTKTLKKLFNEKGIPPRDRDDVAVLCDDAGILFVEGEGPSRRAAVSDVTKEILYITIE